MGLFKKKIKKHEQINMTFSDININDDYHEPKIETKEISKEEMIHDIKSKYDNIIKKNNRVVHDYYICKILSRVGIKDLDFNIQVISLDKHINKLKRDCFYLSHFIDNLKVGYNPNIDEVKKYYNQVKEAEDFQIGLLNQLNEINNNSYGYLRISTVTVCLNKTNEELEELYNNISKELEGFKSFEEASEYIYYNSGTFIDSLINLIIQYVKMSKVNNQIETFTWNYFLPSDVVISLDYNEWIELYNKIKFAMKKIIRYDEKKYQKLHEIVSQFESKYAILMMHYDGKNGK